MYIFHRVCRDNLVTMETRLKIEHQNCYSSLLYDKKLNLLNLRGIQRTRKNVFIKMYEGGGGGPKSGRVKTQTFLVLRYFKQS